MKLLTRSLAFILGSALVFTLAEGDPLTSPVAQSSVQPAGGVALLTAGQLQQLVAPIALYPDPMVAQILAAATYPTEIVEASRWMQQNSTLKGEQLASAVDPQPWDPSVKALTQFSSVLANMNQNLAWTSALGDAYVNQQSDVLNAVQILRQRAQAAGSLQSTSQQSVTTQGQTIVIEPADPQVVYVPAYDPWLVYGAPLSAYPDWVAVPQIFYDGPNLYFGAGFGIGLFAGFGWAWDDWGCDWQHRRLTYHHEPYVSHSRTFANRNDFDRGRTHFANGPAHLDHAAAFHGSGPDRTSLFHTGARTHGNPSPRVGAFSGFDHGGTVRGFSARGRSSFSGGFQGGGFHAGGFQGGGFHGGGARGGGGHR